MNKREFERELFTAIEGYFGGDGWKDKRGRNFNWVMDGLAIDTDPEQWLVVDLTFDLLRDPDFITGEVPCSTPASPNEWVVDFETSPSTPDPDYQPNAPTLPPEPPGWWFCVEDMIPQQMTAEQAWNYTGPFTTEREAFIAVIKQMDDRINSLVAELKFVRGRVR
jgi:hypothetical protein